MILLSFRALLSGVIGTYIQSGMTLDEVASELEMFAHELRNPSFQRTLMATATKTATIANEEFEAHRTRARLHLVPPPVEPVELEP